MRTKRERFLLIRAHELLLAHKKGTIPPYSCPLAASSAQKGNDSSLFVPTSCFLCSKRERFLLIRAPWLHLVLKKGTIPPYSCPRAASCAQKGNDSSLFVPTSCFLCSKRERFLLIRAIYLLSFKKIRLRIFVSIIKNSHSKCTEVDSIFILSYFLKKTWLAPSLSAGDRRSCAYTIESTFILS